MEYRQLGKSGLRVPVLSLGTGTFGGTNEFFKRWGETDVKEASALIDVCLENQLNFFDTANVYSLGAAEEILGAALKGRRHNSIIATKATFATGDQPNDRGASRYHLIRECEASLKRLQTDYIDLYFIHGFDYTTPLEETLSTLNHLVRSGKVRYIGCSNFAAWQLMKALSTSEREGFEKFVVHQIYYSLIGRDAELELLQIGKDQGIGSMIWSPLAWGRLTGKIRRDAALPEGRIKSGGDIGGPQVSIDLLYNAVDILNGISIETGKTIPQIAINWLLQQQTVCNVVIGARNVEQLKDNLGAVEWRLSNDHLQRLDKIARPTSLYPHWVGAR
ncbi:aldo/keto reductase [Chryseosolibacter indicus]|uniref:Aldo/keto reductase n=1 Tax=Chryseosolibacter indicus TaxID=2782351 RepID=A0ABS5VSN0_9BACT|nr:aldo/keto reductase [Chryseosolibacter indicus]MBT1704033.1 aldo/keto reductase [Chryseosolibacter indicus]